MIDLIVDDDLDGEIKASIVGMERIQEAFQVTLQCLNMNPVELDLCIRFASNATVQTLNATWRNKDRVTDVLSFPMQEADELNVEEALGDMILALPFVLQEARSLERDAYAHQLHLMIHSLLHLLAYDHIQDEDALIMQSLECLIMKTLNLHQPYPDLIVA